VKLTAALAALLLLTLAPPALAIDEGVPDRDRHPQVGMLGFDVDGAGPATAAFLCSGSVLSDRHFLTAAHCIPFPPAGSEWVVTLAPGTPAAPVYRPGVFPDDFPFPLTVPAVRGGIATVHPDFDPERLAHDLAIIEFAAGSFAGSTPLTLPTRGLADRRRKVRLVGYGADPERGDESAVFVAEGYRQTRLTTVRPVSHRQVELRGGGCLGDSGSPQLLAGTGIAISTFSQHGPDCDAPFLAQRLDTRAELRFIASVVGRG
jgi:hypothetical protein